MRAGARRRVAVGLLILAGAGGAARAQQPSPSPPAATLPPRPVTESVEKVIDQIEEKQKDPCREAKAKGVPCFPVSTVIHGPEISVRQGLEEAVAAEPRSKLPPRDDMQRFRPGPVGQVIPLVTFDPGCVGKSALKRLKGKNDTYYLYRVHDGHGARVEMYDHRLDPNAAQGNLEFLGKFVGECDALAAYNRESRRVPPAPARSPSPSPAPSGSPR